MGDCPTCDLRVNFDRPVRLTFVGRKVTSDAGRLAYRELAEVLRLTATAEKRLEDSRPAATPVMPSCHFFDHRFTAGWPATRM